MGEQAFWERDEVKRLARNEAHISKPQAGDYWQEMLCPYFVVLGTVCGRVLICDKTKPVDGHHWTWDLTEIKLETTEQLRKRVSYSAINGFCADVVPHAHKWAAEEVSKEVSHD